MLAGRSLSVVLQARVGSVSFVRTRIKRRSRRTSSPMTTQGMPASRYWAAILGTPPHSPVLRFWMLLASPLAALIAPIRQFCRRTSQRDHRA